MLSHLEIIRMSFLLLKISNWNAEKLNYPITEIQYREPILSKDLHLPPAVSDSSRQEFFYCPCISIVNLRHLTTH